jgi:hypothetical protein
MPLSTSNNFMLRRGWCVPVEISAGLEAYLDEDQADTYLLTPDVINEAWVGIKNGRWNVRRDGQPNDVLTKTTFIRLLTDTQDSDHDRCFAPGVQRFMDMKNISVSQLVYALRRNSDALIMTGFDVFELSDQYDRVISNVTHESAFAWVILGLNLRLGDSITELAQRASEQGYEFDDIARYVRVGVGTVDGILSALQEDIDPSLFVSMNAS